jgi:hypothetical protein
MARLRVLLLLAATLALPAPVAAASPTTVAGDAGWVSTGIVVTRGQHLAISANGTVQTAPIPDFHVPGVFKSSSGPAGQTDNPTCGEVTDGFDRATFDATGPCAIDEAYFGELVGRIGTTKFVIGAGTDVVAPRSGVLELAANDLTLTYFDNNGSFTVFVR